MDLLAGVVELAAGAQLAAPHSGIGERVIVPEAVLLPVTGSQDLLALNGGRMVGIRLVGMALPDLGWPMSRAIEASARADCLLFDAFGCQ